MLHDPNLPFDAETALPLIANLGLVSPEDHPLWPLQVRLEGLMREQGVKRMADIETEARGKRSMTRLAPVRHLVTDWITPVANTFKDWRSACRRQSGPMPIAYAYLKDMDADLAAFIAVRTVLDSVTIERTAASAMARAIGSKVEYELKLRAMEKANPKLMRAIYRDQEREKSTAEHRLRANINRSHYLLATGQVDMEWQAWSEEAQYRVGVALLDAIIRATAWFTLGDNPHHVFRKGKASSPALVLLPKQGLIDFITKGIDRQGLLSPVFMPTVLPPQRWAGTRRGGYWTHQVNTPRLIRFKASQTDQKDAAADEYEALSMPLVYEALHVVQEVPWKVNAEVLAVAEALWLADTGTAGLPYQGEIPMPVGSEDLEGRALKQHKKAMARVYKKRVKQVSLVAAVDRTLSTAIEYAEHGHPFYFPHMLDFRGRMYPIPTGLQPQGDDLARGLLTFAEPFPVTTENQGDLWLAIHLASVWGNDKWDFTRRIQWVWDNEAMFREVAADPTGDLRWQQSDKPFQALAACLEWVRWLDEGGGMMSYLPVSVDGTCNGIQHLSAMTRDKVAGQYVNLVPGAEPQDIYQFVATHLQAVLERIEAGGGEEGEKATYWLDLCQRKLGRSITKRQVMVLPYGGTMDSFLTYVREWLEEYHPEELEDEDGEGDEEGYLVRGRRIGFLAKHMWSLVGEKVPGAVKVMKWLRDCAACAARGDQPIFWITPTGFVVRHFYGKQAGKQMETKLDGRKVFIKLNTTTKDLDRYAQLKGIAPNFVHSLDADALRKCILLCRDRGVTAFTAIHDAYGTHAGNMGTLSLALREAFVELHKTDVLGNFRQACASVMIGLLVAEGMDPDEAMQKADEDLPQPLEMGELDIEGVLTSDYFFA